MKKLRRIKVRILLYKNNTNPFNQDKMNMANKNYIRREINQMILDDIKEIINETFKINKEIIEMGTPLYNGG